MDWNFVIDQVNASNWAKGSGGRGRPIDCYWRVELEIPVRDVPTNTTTRRWVNVLAGEEAGTRVQTFPGGLALEPNVNEVQVAFERAFIGGIAAVTQKVLVTGACRPNATNRTVQESTCFLRGSIAPSGGELWRVLGRLRS